MEQEQKDTLNWLEETLVLCTGLGQESRETVWIRDRFEDVARSQNLSGRGALDRLVFARLYGRPPEKSTKQLPIRYWRTGRHKPQSREQCLALGRALALDEADTAFLLQGYYDSADRIFSPTDHQDPVYRRRRSYLEALETQYLAAVHPLELERLNIPWEKPGEYLRHCYVQDARQYVDTKNKLDGTSHLNSANYVNEFQRLRFFSWGRSPERRCCATCFCCPPPLSPAPSWTRDWRPLDIARLMSSTRAALASGPIFWSCACWSGISRRAGDRRPPAVAHGSAAPAA